MECSVCDVGDELLYVCGRCGEHLCATHHGRSYHRCTPAPDGDWTPPGTRDTTQGDRSALLDRSDEEPTVERPAAQLYPDATGGTEAGGDGATTEPAGAEPAGAEPAGAEPAAGDFPPDAARPGYGPDRLRPDPVEPAQTLSEWLRRETYVSLTVKVGFVATLWSAFVFSTLAVALSLSLG